MELSKAECRRELRRARHAREHDDSHGGSIRDHVLDLAAIQEACAAGAFIACYASRPEEPPTDELRKSLRDAGARVLLPRVEGENLVWCLEDSNGELVENSWAIPEPAGEPIFETPAAWVIPALAVDQEGYRLGQGGGFYDRALADLPEDGRGPIIALVFEDEFWPEVPREDHDHRVDVVVTPQTVRWLAMPD